MRLDHLLSKENVTFVRREAKPRLNKREFSKAIERLLMKKAVDSIHNYLVLSAHVIMTIERVKEKPVRGQRL